MRSLHFLPPARDQDLVSGLDVKRLAALKKKVGVRVGYPDESASHVLVQKYPLRPVTFAGIEIATPQVTPEMGA